METSMPLLNAMKHNNSLWKHSFLATLALATTAIADAQSKIFDAYGPTTEDQFGYTLQSMPNINNTGRDAIAVASPRSSGSSTGSGQAGMVEILGWTAPGTFQVIETIYAPGGIGTGTAFGREFAITRDTTGTKGVIGEPEAGLAMTTATGRIWGIGGVGPSFPTAMDTGGLQDELGSAVAALDLDGDGIDEYLVGAPVSFVAQGSQLAYVQVYDASGIPLATINAPTVNTRFGAAIGALGDLDGDGIGEFLVGAPFTSSGSGAAYLYSGATQTLMATFAGGTGDLMGTQVGSAGYVDNDSVPDFYISSPNYTPTSGLVAVYSGATLAPIYQAQGSNTVFQYFGNAVAGGGDVNGDGHDDLIVGEATSTNLATIFSGANGAVLSTIPRDASNDSAEVTSTALADVDGNGIADAIVGQGGAGIGSSGRMRVYAFGQENIAWYGSTSCYGEENSTGVAATFNLLGSAVLANQDLTVHVEDMPLFSFGYMLLSMNQGMIVHPGGSCGNICLGGTIHRWAAGNVFQSNVYGEVNSQVDFSVPLYPSTTLLAGQAWYVQVWYRDAVLSTATGCTTPGQQVTSNLSNSVAVTWQ